MTPKTCRVQKHNIQYNKVVMNFCLLKLRIDSHRQNKPFLHYFSYRVNESLFILIYNNCLKNHNSPEAFLKSLHHFNSKTPFLFYIPLSHMLLHVLYFLKLPAPVLLNVPQLIFWPTKQQSSIPLLFRDSTLIPNLCCIQDKAYSYQDVELEQHGNCPVPSGVLTPPLSSEKTEEMVRVDSAVLKIRPRLCTPSPQWPQSSETNTDN